MPQRVTNTESTDTMPRLHAIPHEGQWALRSEGETRNIAVMRSREEALTAGRAIARQRMSSFVVHNKDGKVQRVLEFA